MKRSWLFRGLTMLAFCGSVPRPRSAMSSCLYGTPCSRLSPAFTRLRSSRPWVCSSCRGFYSAGCAGAGFAAGSGAAGCRPVLQQMTPRRARAISQPHE